MSGFLNDDDKKVFLVQMDIGKKLVPQSKECLISCISTQGPSFGYGDLVLFDETIKSGLSYTKFAHTFNSE